jgi:hypothetical protein
MEAKKGLFFCKFTLIGCVSTCTQGSLHPSGVRTEVVNKENSAGWKRKKVTSFAISQ